MISTRRFRARPSHVALSASGKTLAQAAEDGDLGRIDPALHLIVLYRIGALLGEPKANRASDCRVRARTGGGSAATASVGGGGGGVTAVERGCGTAVATGAGFTILPQPSIALSGLHEDVRTQFP
jgi:hypothetical protein